MNSNHPNIPHPKWLLFALATGGFAIGTTEFATMSLIPQIAASLSVDEPAAGHLISAYALGVVVGAPLIAVLASRFSRRLLLIGLMIFFCLAHIASASAESYSSLLMWRFLCGLPHGAYFGVGALVAAGLVPMAQRAKAVGMMMIGLTVASTIGVPLTNWLGQALGWRAGFLLVAVLAAVTAISVAWFLPRGVMSGGGSSPLRELKALTNSQVWLTLGIGAIGFGGLFAVYTYMASTLMEVTGVSATWVPLVLSLFGVGMTVGNLLAPRLVGKSVMPAIAGLLLWSLFSLALFPFAAANLMWLSVVVVMIGIGGAIGTLIQVRLMDIAKDSQTLAAALNHSAFNLANALGPLLGGLAISAGYGWTSTGWVGCGLALGGLLLWAVSFRKERRTAV